VVELENRLMQIRELLPERFAIYISLPIFYLLGDDCTYEDMFKSLPDNALTNKVGVKNSYVKFSIKTQEQVMTILETFL
jgi:trehalose-6-phosphatase